jgi:hypothetical protein
VEKKINSASFLESPPSRVARATYLLKHFLGLGTDIRIVKELGVVSVWILATQLPHLDISTDEIQQGIKRKKRRRRS